MMAWRRRTSLVDPKLQLWMALEQLAVLMGFLVILLFFMFVPPMGNLFGDPSATDRLLQELIESCFTKWPLVVSAFLVFFAISVLMSHRLIGPLVGLKATLKRWQNGDFKARVRFRKYDQVVSVMGPLNNFFDTQEQLLKAVASQAKEGLEKNPNGEAAMQLKTIMQLVAPKE